MFFNGSISSLYSHVSLVDLFFSSFYFSDLSYTVPSIVFFDFRAVFNVYIKVVLRCFFTCDRLSCLRRLLKRIIR